MPLETIVYHLNYLEKRELLVCTDDGGYKRYYAKGTHPLKDKQTIALLRQPTPRKILMCLILKKNQTHKALASELGIAPSTLSFHLNKLLKSGLMKKIVDGKEHRFFIEDEENIAKLIIQYKSGLIDDIVERFIEAWSDLHP